MNFSIILNTRGRIFLLTNLLNSIEKTTHNLQNVEVFLCVDTDDNETLQFCQNLHYNSRYSFLNTYIVDPSENLHKNLNEVFKYTKGKYVLVLNDDCEMLGEGWDTKSIAILDQYLADKPDGICYGRTHDTSVDKGGNKEYASFPVLSAKAVKAAGFVMPEYVKGWGGDVLSWRIYNSINRIVDLPDLVIEHVLHNKLDKIFNPDSTQNFIRQISAQNNIDYFTADITAHTTQLNSIICQKQESKLKKGNKLCIVYNTCGISGTEKVNNYINSLRTILNQDFEGSHVVISGCLNSANTKNKLRNEFGNEISYNWIDEKLPVNVTFNHSCLEARKQFGDFDGYLYIDSGVYFTDNLSVNKLYELYKSGEYGIVSAQTDTDEGYDQWFNISSNDAKKKLFDEKNLIVPLGKAINSHCQIYSRKLIDYYNSIIPDIFASYCTESTFTFLVAALNLKWIISKDVVVCHLNSMDGASSGFSPVEWAMKGKSLYNHPFIVDSILDIMNEGGKYGMGYEECKNVLLHDKNKFDELGHSNDHNLKEFIKNKLFLANSDKFDYKNIKNIWE